LEKEAILVIAILSGESGQDALQGMWVLPSIDIKTSEISHSSTTGIKVSGFGRTTRTVQIPVSG
jgi:hypothetical protein